MNVNWLLSYINLSLYIRESSIHSFHGFSVTFNSNVTKMDTNYTTMCLKYIESTTFVLLLSTLWHIFVPLFQVIYR